MSNEELIELSRNVQKNAISNLTGCSMAAVLICKNGKIYYGVNIENEDSCSLSNCAERVAISNAIASGEKEFIKIAITGNLNGEQLKNSIPCGACRQFMLRYAPNIEIIYIYEGKITSKKLDELLPYSYSLNGNK